LQVFTFNQLMLTEVLKTTNATYDQMLAEQCFEEGDDDEAVVNWLAAQQEADEAEDQGAEEQGAEEQGAEEQGNLWPVTPFALWLPFVALWRYFGLWRSGDTLGS
jgi:hypothetical protein